MIGCSEAVKQLWEYLEGDLGGRNKQQVEEHLTFCLQCCGELEFAKQLHRLMTRNTQVELTPSVEAQLLDFIQELEAEGSK